MPARPASRHSDHLTTSADPGTRYFNSSPHSRDRNTKEYGDAETSIPQNRSKDRSQQSEEEKEKPWPRRGKTRIPRKLLHEHAILDLGYPFREDVSQVTISGRECRSETKSMLMCQ